MFPANKNIHTLAICWVAMHMIYIIHIDPAWSTTSLLWLTRLNLIQYAYVSTHQKGNKFIVMRLITKVCTNHEISSHTKKVKWKGYDFKTLGEETGSSHLFHVTGSIWLLVQNWFCKIVFSEFCATISSRGRKKVFYFVVTIYSGLATKQVPPLVDTIDWHDIFIFVEIIFIHYCRVQCCLNKHFKIILIS